MTFKLADLPYNTNALEPYITADSLEYHHARLQRSYVNNLNFLLQDAAGRNETRDELEGVIMSSAGAVFNNASQVWSHTFYWHCMKPGGGGRPIGELATAIDRTFGSVETLAKQLTEAGESIFGSGWVWLVLDGGAPRFDAFVKELTERSNGQPDTGSVVLDLDRAALQVVTTDNADLPLKRRQTALLAIDVWEHAYYVDYRGLRAKYIEVFLQRLVNWDFVASNYRAAVKGK